MRIIPPSPKPLLNKTQRIVSYGLWGQWLFAFLWRETSGLLRYIPWRTFSESVWDFEKHRPGTKREILAFALALGAHIYFRTEMKAEYEWALSNVDDFTAWLEQHGGQ